MNLVSISELAGLRTYSLILKELHFLLLTFDKKNVQDRFS